MMWQKNCNKIPFLPRRTNEMEGPPFRYKGHAGNVFFILLAYPSTCISVCNLKNKDNANSNSQSSGERCEF